MANENKRNDAPLKLDRRDFLKSVGLGTGSAAALASCGRAPVRHAIPLLVADDHQVPGVAAHYASTCSACPAACGQLVTVREGRPVKLEGLPSHPVSKGGLCAIGQADLRALYEPKRPQAPAIAGAKSTWEALDERVAKGLTAAKAAGKQVVVLSTTLTSPTGREVITSFLKPFSGKLVEFDADATTASAALEAWQQVAGRPLLPALHIDRADLLVTLGGDLLANGSEPVAHARQYADRKRAASKAGAFKHVHVGATISLTGAGADERLTATAGEQRAIAAWLLRRIAEASKDDLGKQVATSLGGATKPPHAERIEALAKELLAHPSKSLLVSGADDRGEQLAVALSNKILGNLGATMDVDQPSLVRRGLDAELLTLRAALDKGEVGAIFVLGLDPAHQLPDGAGWLAKIKAAGLSVLISDRPSTSAADFSVVAAAHHGLESWGDAMSRPGLWTPQQPTVRPLFNTRGTFASFLTWSGAKETDYRKHLMASWQANVYGGAPSGFEAFWDRTLAAGIGAAPGTTPGAPATPPPPAPPAAPAADLPAPATAVDMHVAATPVAEPETDTPTIARTDWLSPAQPAATAALVAGLAGATAKAAAADVEVEFIAEVAIGNGSHAHVPWLRELPDPLTRCSWTPVARVAPKLAERLGVADGDLLSIDVGGRKIEIAARVLPGSQAGTIGVPVGYAAHNAWTLASTADGRLQTRGLAAKVSRTGANEALPLIQWSMTTHGRPIIHQVKAHDAKVPAGHDLPYDLWDEHPPGQGPGTEVKPRWEMAIDLDACTGCSACIISCQAENNVPVVGADEIRRHRDLFWLRIDRYFVGAPDNPDVVMEPMLCQHCDHAPCETVCPVLATMHSSDGLNMQVYNRCVGTRYCANNCAYKVRRFNWFNYDKGGPVERMVFNPDVVVRDRGVMEKCSFCTQRIQAARIASKREGKDSFQVQTACQQSCPTGAITFGDRNDKDGELNKWKKNPRAFQVLADVGVKPSITYLARVRNRAGEPDKGKGGHA